MASQWLHLGFHEVSYGDERADVIFIGDISRRFPENSGGCCFLRKGDGSQWLHLGLLEVGYGDERADVIFIVDILRGKIKGFEGVFSVGALDVDLNLMDHNGKHCLK
ncbi:hypothetical protein CEXT_286881 [Caerostris extrusa]|uniref:Uncharacterized protein n=1 Tax=Caerostris extrusa TaxID=172846 RepID=A0AAV4TGF3_CAEEX|nr:hypothetical protein CEXT_286881 [Caerostris extrusa]